MNAWLEVLPSHEPAVHRQRVQLLIGTVNTTARVSLLRMNDDEQKSCIMPGSGGPVQLITDAKITAAAGRRFVIRSCSPPVTIGGGRILLPNAESVRDGAERAAKAEIVEELSDDFGPVSLLAAIVRDRGILNHAGLFKLSQMEKSFFEKCADLLRDAPDKYGLLEFGASRNFISGETFHAAARSVLRFLHTFHEKYPESAGLDAENLYASMEGVHGAERLKLGDFKDLIGVMAARNIIAPAAAARGKTCYGTAGNNRSRNGRLLHLAGRIRQEAASAGFNLAKLPELEKKLNAAPEEMKRAMAYLREQDALWILEGGLLFPQETKEKLLTALASMNHDITVASLRDFIGVSRKYTLPMLEFLDAQGLTRRIGDKRLLM
ncbi:MAG: SelB C-terminal domain-containing protein [Treponema sp.]|nr:SelB C-terminal domain-containing protein [Treponema sp.]